MSTDDVGAAVDQAVVVSWRLVGEVMADSVERRLAPRFDALDQRVAGVEERLSAVEQGQVKLTERVSGVEGRLSGVEGRLSAVELGQVELKEQVGRLENSTRREFQRITANLEEIRGLFVYRERHGDPQPPAPRKKTRPGG